MAGLGIRLFTDEHVHAALAGVLRQRGYDAESCREAGRDHQGISDEDQLTYATQQGRAILTNDFTDFEDEDRKWKAANRPHAGIIVYSRSPTFSALLLRVQRHLDTTDPQVQHNLLLWPP